MMNLSRIKSVVDTDKLQRSHVMICGVGGGSGIAENLTRCGVGRFTLCDPDTVADENIARQGHETVGMQKVDSTAAKQRQINRHVDVTTLPIDITTLSDEQAKGLFGSADLLVLATDSFLAQSKGNRIALKLGIPALWIGLYRGAGAGEIVFWHEGIDACFQCLMASRYDAAEQAAKKQQSVDPPSDGATIFDVTYIDSIAGMLALGLLTMGADNRFGRLIPALGQRNFLQTKIDPDWTLRDSDPVREFLGVAEDCNAYFSWNTIVRADGVMHTPCPDCEELRGHSFTPHNMGHWFHYERVIDPDANREDSEEHSAETSSVDELEL